MGFNSQECLIKVKRIFKNRIKSARLIKTRTDILCAANKIWRLQTAVKANFNTGIRFAEFLGFKNETIANLGAYASVFGTGKFYKEKQDEKKENIYSNIDEMLGSTLKEKDSD